MTWSPQQEKALKEVLDWFDAENAQQIFRLFGYAGTGKTTLAIEIAKRIRTIIRLSMDVREGKPLEYGDFGACKIVPWKKEAVDPQDILSADQVLVGKNVTRHQTNARIRALKGIQGPNPTVGERLVCLRNNREKSLFNGGIWSVSAMRKQSPAVVKMVVTPEDAGATERSVEIKVHPYFFEGREGELDWKDLKDFDQFTFGWALTVHKSQGSQWNNVFLFDESRVFRDDARRWLYTAITRAAERLTVVMP